MREKKESVVGQTVGGFRSGTKGQEEEHAVSQDRDWGV